MPIGLSIIFIYMVLRINVYPTLLSGWRSNRKYAMVGALRAIAQTISYEVSLALIFLFFLFLGSTLSLHTLITLNTSWVKVFIFPPLAGLWLISCVAETNRTPFDFAEGESELVSGFNIEYGAVGFALIFIAEYARILFMSVIFVSVFLVASLKRLVSCTRIAFTVGVWIWLRTTFPRYRFDLLINLAWKSFLPVALIILGATTTLISL